MEKITKYLDSKVGLVVKILISILAGLSLLINPEDVSNLVIRGVGFIWVLEGVAYAFELAEKYIRKE